MTLNLDYPICGFEKRPRSPVRAIMCVGVVLILGMLQGITNAQSASAHAVVPPSEASATAKPPVPSSLEQRPASAPQVAFNAGQLTIVARNSTLGAILQDVEAQTGASIDMPNLPADRVVGQFGPGPAREVLAALLNGSHFNYVLLSSPQNPDALERVVLLAKSSGSDPAIPGGDSAAAYRGSEYHGSAYQGSAFRQGPAVMQAQDADEPVQDNAEEMAEPEQAATNEEQADQNGSQPLNGAPTIKTPQQLLQELQRQQQAQAPPPVESQTPQRRPD